MFTNEEENFEVFIEDFANRHFIKQFKKKYKNGWDITKSAIVQELSRIDNLIGLTNKAEIIKSKDYHLIIKLDFRMAGTQESTKSSGNRAIVYTDTKTKVCKVLLVYSKNDISNPNETQKWQAIIKENFPSIWNIFN